MDCSVVVGGGDVGGGGWWWVVAAIVVVHGRCGAELGLGGHFSKSMVWADMALGTIAALAFSTRFSAGRRVGADHFPGHLGELVERGVRRVPPHAGEASTRGQVREFLAGRRDGRHRLRRRHGEALERGVRRVPSHAGRPPLPAPPGGGPPLLKQLKQSKPIKQLNRFNCFTGFNRDVKIPNKTIKTIKSI